MALFNYATRELSAKIVYYGPGLSGKTTNIEKVHHLLRPEQKGKLISLPTETDRTLFFDFLPLDLGEIKGFRVRFHLYTVPGQVFYNSTRRLVLQGVDGVVFVADSQANMMESNVESLTNLVDNLASYGKKLQDLPFVLQYNKRDLRSVSSVGEMDGRLNARKVPRFEAVAVSGTGVTETLVAISRLVFDHLQKTLLLPGDEVKAAAAGAARRSPAAEPEPLEEISEIEEIGEEARSPRDLRLPDEGVTDFGSLSRPTGASADGAEDELLFEGLEEIEIEIPERAAGAGGEAPAAEPANAVPTGKEGPVRGAAPRPPGSAAAGAEGALPFDGLEEIEIEIPERAAAGTEPPAPAPEAAIVGPAAIAVETEESDLTFLKFDDVVLSTEGFVILPVVFLDREGNPVRIRIKISMAGGPE